MVQPSIRSPSRAGEVIVRPGRLSEMAKASIRSRINSGEIAVGQIHSVPSIAETLGVSVTPVREAMLDLAAEGVVEAVPNRGFRVIELTARDLDEIYQLRLMLEVPAMAGLASPRLAEAQLQRFDQLADEIERTAEKGDGAAFLEADRAFHLAMLEACGNRRLTELVQRLRDQARLVGVDRLAREGQLRSSAGEHHQIVDAIRAGNAKRVTMLVTRHLRHTRGIWAGVDEHDAS